MKKYIILDTESTRDFAYSLIGMIFEGEYIKENEAYRLNTCDGELLFDEDEIKELDENHIKIYEYCEKILSENVNANEKKDQLYGFLRGITQFIDVIKWDNLFHEYCLKINYKAKKEYEVK